MNTGAHNLSESELRSYMQKQKQLSAWLQIPAMVSNDLSGQQWHHQVKLPVWFYTCTLVICEICVDDDSICQMILVVCFCLFTNSIPVRNGVFYSSARMSSFNWHRLWHHSMSHHTFSPRISALPFPISISSRLRLKFVQLRLCICAQSANRNTDALCLAMEKLFHHVSSPCLVQCYTTRLQTGASHTCTMDLLPTPEQ